MNITEIGMNKNIVTSVSMSLELYSQVLKKAKAEKLSFSEIVRRALYREFEAKGKRLEKCD